MKRRVSESRRRGRPPRPMPPDFVERWVELGWGVEQNYGASTTQVQRWRTEIGVDRLKCLRDRYLAERAARRGLQARSRSKRHRLSITECDLDVAG